jgi:heat shock protein HtpX
MEALDDRELRAVLAHELAHIRNGDARLGLIAAVFVGVISLGFDMMTRTRRVARAGASSRGWRVNGGSRNAGAAALIGLLIIALAWGLAAVLRMMLSRNREFLADAGAVELTSDPDAMISALRKVEGRAEMPEVSPQVRALFLEDATDSALSSLMATHPPIPERVAALVRFAGGRDPGPMERAAIEEEAPPWAQQDASDETIRVAPGQAPVGDAPWWQGPARQGGGGENSPWGPRR